MQRAFVTTLSLLTSLLVTPGPDCARALGAIRPVSIETATSAPPSEPAEDVERTRHVPVGLLCPTVRGAGTLILVTKNGLGEAFRGRYGLKHHLVFSAFVEHFDVDGTRRIIMDLDASRLRTLGNAIKFDERTSVIQTLNAKICEDEEIVVRNYLEKIEAYRRALEDVGVDVRPDSVEP